MRRQERAVSPLHSWLRWHCSIKAGCAQVDAHVVYLWLLGLLLIHEAG